MRQPRRPIAQVSEADRLATRKLADRYINRKGGSPSMREAARDARHQDLNDDDRKHLKWCLRRLLSAVYGSGEQNVAAFEFVEALLDRDYRLYTKDQRREDESAIVTSDEDPELYAHMERKKR